MFRRWIGCSTLVVVLGSRFHPVFDLRNACDEFVVRREFWKVFQWVQLAQHVHELEDVKRYQVCVRHLRIERRVCDVTCLRNGGGYTNSYLPRFQQSSLRP